LQRGALFFRPLVERLARTFPLLLLLGAVIGTTPLACGTDKVKSPFGPAAGGAGGEAAADGGAGLQLDVDAGDGADPTLGGPCEDDGQCDDEVDCTADHCDQALGRCRFEPDDSVCENDVYCDGRERCDVRLGCVNGEIVACSDDNTCTIDVCIEETQSCQHEPRDGDGDGDPTRNCGGQDCDDSDPSVSSQASEICGNQRDDDCDGAVDEDDCAAPEHDVCDTALAVSEPGFYDVDLAATALDYGSSCITQKGGFRDAVLQVELPEGGPFDLDVSAKQDGRLLVLGTADSCGDEDSTRCEPSFQTPAGASAARLLLRGVGPGLYPVYVAADAEVTVQVHVDWRPAEPRAGELCEEALPLTAGGEPITFRLADYSIDASSICDPLSATPRANKPPTPVRTGDAYLSFTLSEASDVTLVAEAQNAIGLPLLSLRDASCTEELTCRHSQPGRLFVRDLAPGDYIVAVAATGPDDVSVQLQTAPVSASPPGEGCDEAPPLPAGVEEIVDLASYEDAVFPQCLPGAPDATFELELEDKRDVALVGRFSEGDLGSVSLARSHCTDNRACRAGSGVVRAVSYGVAAGVYRAVVESARGNPVGLSWFERPPVAALHVPYADDCSALIDIPETGGRFSGNTSNSFPDFSAGCDVGGQPEGGAPDQILKLSLSAPRRVVLDMQGSAYNTILSVRQGEFCPGSELRRACAPGYGETRSFLELDLQAGDYFVQIDGYNGASGAWKLDVFTAAL
jgi:hypothetical protein